MCGEKGSVAVIFMKAFEPISRYFLSPIAEDQEVRFSATPLRLHSGQVSPARETRTLPRFPRNSPLVSQANQSPVTDNCLQLTCHRPLIGRGGGVGRPLGVIPGLGVSVGLAVGVAVTVAVAVGVGVDGW